MSVCQRRLTEARPAARRIAKHDASQSGGAFPRGIHGARSGRVSERTKASGRRGQGIRQRTDHDLYYRFVYMVSLPYARAHAPQAERTGLRCPSSPFIRMI